MSVQCPLTDATRDDAADFLRQLKDVRNGRWIEELVLRCVCVRVSEMQEGRCWSSIGSVVLSTHTCVRGEAMRTAWIESIDG